MLQQYKEKKHFAFSEFKLFLLIPDRKNQRANIKE